MARLSAPKEIFDLIPYLDFRKKDLGDLSEWCVRSTQSSGSTPGFHSDMPDTGHAINLRFGLPYGMKDDGTRNLDHGDHLNIDREILDISVTQKEMILAIEGGQHGDPVRCQMRRLSGFVTQEPRYVGPWSDMGEMTEVSTSFTEDMPEYADIPSKAKEISDAMALGASGRRGAPALPGMLRDLAADMDAASDRFVTVSSPQLRAIGEAVDEMAVRSVSGSGILAAWGRISDRMARLIGRSDRGPDF